MANKPRPDPGSIWDRIEQAREALGWNERAMGKEALGNPTHYTKIWERGWNAKQPTVEKIVVRLVQEGFSEAWLRANVGSPRDDGQEIPTPKRISEQLKLLARRLSLQEEQLIALWADLEGVGPLEKLPEEAQRAAFAAAYMEGRTLEDVGAAARQVMRSKPALKSVDSWLVEIRLAVRSIQPGSGTRPGLTLIPGKNG